MDRANLLAITLAICAVNGIFSPFVHLVARAGVLWAPTWLPASAGLLFYLSSLIVATTTLLLAGVPAALLERAVPALRQATLPMWLWALVALILSVPALIRILLMYGVAT